MELKEMFRVKEQPTQAQPVVQTIGQPQTQTQPSTNKRLLKELEIQYDKGCMYFVKRNRYTNRIELWETKLSKGRRKINKGANNE